MLPGQLLLLLLFLMNLWMQGKSLYWDPAEYLSTPSHLAILLVIATGILSVLTEVGCYLSWYLRSRRSVADGGACLPTPSRHLLVWSLLGLMGAALIWQVAAAAYPSTGIFLLFHLLGMAAMIALSWKLTSYLKRKKFSRNANRVLTLTAIVVMTVALMGALMSGLFMALSSGVGERTSPESYEVYGRTRYIYHDDIPLRVEDLTDVDYDGWSTEAETQSTPLAAQTAYTQRPRVGDRTDAPDLEYRVCDVRLPFLEDFFWKGLLRSQSRYDEEKVPSLCSVYKPIDAAPWGADEASRLYDGEGVARNTWLVRWGSRMAELEFRGFRERDMPQAAVIAEKLAP